MKKKHLSFFVLFLLFNLYSMSILKTEPIPPNGAEIWAIKKNQTASGNTEAHILKYGTVFQTFVVNAVTPIAQIYDNSFQFTGSDFSSSFYSDGYRCLWAIKKWGTGTGSTEVHILDPRTDFTSFINQTGTVLPETNDDYYFLAGKYNQDYNWQPYICDLWVIKKQNTTSGFFEVQILSGEQNFQSIIANIVVPIAVNAHEVWQFALGDYNDDLKADLYMFKVFRTDKYPLPNVELHIRNGTNLTSSLYDLNTSIPAMPPSRIQISVGNIQHPYSYSPHRSYVYAIIKNETATNSTEAHILDRNTNYTTFFTETGTILHQTYDNFEFVVGQYRDATENTEKINQKYVDTKTSNEQTNSYPNPFNPQTTIVYSVKEPSFVKIKVFDVLGRLIETLVNEKKGIGEYNVLFIANNLSSGMYFYRVEIGEKAFVRKLVLAR